MFYANTFTLKMENKKMAAKALEVMREALAQIDADGFKYDSRKTVDDFDNDLMVKGSAVIAPGNCGLMPDANNTFGNKKTDSQESQKERGNYHDRYHHQC